MRKNSNTLFASLALILTVATGPAALVVTAGPAMARGDGGGGGGSSGADGRGGDGGNNPALSFLIAQRGDQQRGIGSYDPGPIGCNARLPIRRFQCRSQ